jgi:serine/threonine protein kinase
VCHRDLKPENILFAEIEGDDSSLKAGQGGLGFHEPVITDFGLAVSYSSLVNLCILTFRFVSV